MARAREVATLTQQLLAELVVSREGLARELGVSYDAVYAWSTGRRSPAPASAQLLAEFAARRARRMLRLAEQLEHAARTRAS